MQPTSMNRAKCRRSCPRGTLEKNAVAREDGVDRAVPTGMRGLDMSIVRRCWQNSSRPIFSLPSNVRGGSSSTIASYGV